MLLVSASVLALAVGTDLVREYPPTLTYPSPGGLEWTSTEDDVWSLRSFAYEVPGRFRIELGAGNVVFGVHADNVVWACVFPDQPAAIESDLEGGGEHVSALFLRFHPARLGELFPEQSVGRKGPLEYLTRARRQYAAKIDSAFSWDHLPILPELHVVALDADTSEGTRRAYLHDARRDTIEWMSGWGRSAVPAPAPMKPRDARALYDQVFEAFDETYANFGLVPEVDWDRLGRRYRKLAAKAETAQEAAGAVALLLEHLQDLHARVVVDGEEIWSYRRFRPLNANWSASQHMVGGVGEGQHGVSTGRTADGIGYVNVAALEDARCAAAFDDALQELEDTWGLVLDLRWNEGGGEDLARAIAARFVPRPVVYGSCCFRDGSKRDALGPPVERSVSPRPWLYRAPVVVLVGRRTMAAAESLTLMMAGAPGVTTMGDTTAGSSGNPRQLELEGNVVVSLPTWRDLAPDGQPIEHRGVAPDVRVEYRPDEMGDNHDPVLAAALERLRELPEGERSPARGG